MELHAQSGTKTERLHLGLLGSRQWLRALRQRHHVVMPVQHIHGFVPHGKIIMLVNAFDRRKTDFRRLSRLELRPQRGGDNLMSQAHAQHRLAHTDCSPRELGLGL